ncbi:hypothetical protein C8C88_0907 [Flavobacterium sp. 123]|jgi:hypothetical protein|nr:hypothetical protein C8C88_0907 [Flavobacterium sp. 123]
MNFHKTLFNYNLKGIEIYLFFTLKAITGLLE